MTRIVAGARAWMSALALTAIRVAVAGDEWLTVRVNGVPSDDPTLVHVDGSGNTYLDAAAVGALHLPTAVIGERVQLYGTDFFRLRQRPGLRVTHADDDSLEIAIDPWLYAAQESHAADGGLPFTAGSLGVFANYDALLETGAFHEGALQLMTGASSGRYSLATSGIASEGDYVQSARLDTTFRADFPEYRATFGAGDLITSTVASPVAVRFAGLQWTTDFATQPGFIPQAMPGTSGVAIVPSAVDLYVNGSAVAHRDVNAGPFSIEDVPIPVGTGLVELHIRDALGREQVIAQPFLVTPLLLQPGLTASSFEMGVLREDYGLRSFRYGQSFIAAAARHGFTDVLTLQGGIEALGSQSTVRAASVVRAGEHTILQLGGGLSHADLGRAEGRTGGTLDLALHVFGDFVDFGSEWQQASRSFRDLQTLDASTSYLRSASAQLSLRLPYASSLSALYARRELASGDVGTVTTINFSRSRLFGGALNAYASYSKLDRGELSFGIIFTLSRGPTSFGGGVSGDGSGNTIDFRAGRPADRDSVWGWDVGGRAGAHDEAVARLDAVTDYGTGNLQAATQGGRFGASLGWHGGWIWADGEHAATAPIVGAIGIIHVPGAADVPVYQGGQIIGRTDSDGSIIATTLREFEPNALTVNAADLPLGAWIDRSEITVRPYARNIVSLSFPIHATSADLILRLPDGSFVPAGAAMRLVGVTAPVGDGGITSIPNTGADVLHVRWGGQACTVAMTPEIWQKAQVRAQAVQCRPETPP